MKRILSVALCLCLSGCATIQPGERAVKVSLGSLDKTLISPGLIFYTPGIDHIYTYSIKQNTVEGKAQPLTADQQAITIEYKVQYKIPEGQVLSLYQSYNGDPYSMLVDPQIQEAFRQVISQYKADAAIKSINTIKDQVVAMVSGNLKGLVSIVDIPITHTGLPEVLQNAIAEKQIMEQKSLQKQYELDAAKKQAEITIANAQAQSEAIKLQTDALAKSPQLIEYEKIKKWDGKLPDTVVTSGQGVFQIFGKHASDGSK